MIQLNSLTTTQINESIQNTVGGFGRCKNQRTIKKEIVKLLDVSLDVSANPEVIRSQFMGMLSQFLPDYENLPQDAKEPEILNLFATMIRKLKETLNDELPAILTGLVQNSLNFLFKDFES